MNLSGESDLRKILENAVYEHLFGEENVYSGISDQLYLSQVKQKSYLSLNYESVSLPSETETVIECMTGPRVDMKLNRPFIYEVVSSNGLLLLVGIATDPIAQQQPHACRNRN